MIAAAVAALLSVLAADLQVRDLNGKAQRVELGSTVTVVTFVSTTCPVSNAYNDRMIAAYQDYSKQGVKFVFVDANVNESASEIAAYQKTVGFPFAIYRDQNVAEQLGAQVTPEAFVFDRAGKLRYQGAIDDSRNAARVRNQALRDALDAVLGGKALAQPVLKAFGCTIKKAGRN